jgi:GH15 family glucan-1,4-alpha-glucosidase
VLLPSPGEGDWRPHPALGPEIGQSHLSGSGHRRHARGTTVERYPDISDHGLIGDLQTTALVGTDGTIDYFCCPRFDSPSVFCSLLDAERGGYFRISPVADS